MPNVIFNYNGQEINIQCAKTEKMKDICLKFVNKIVANLDNLFFLCGDKLNFEKKFNELIKDNNINEIHILVLEKSKNRRTCTKCGEYIDDKIYDVIINNNKNIKEKIIGIKSQIEKINNNNDLTINQVKTLLNQTIAFINDILQDIQKKMMILLRNKILIMIKYFII